MRALGVLAVSLVLALGSVVPASAAARPPHFANCTAMHKASTKYRGGIARVGAHDKRPNGGHARYKPYVNTAYYNANIKMDRDHDGIACEQ
ncbi:MAG: hypothetical protein JWO57_4516 [Pseudonocardiales bacterium]|jgi:hypothetical protein|nr:hypothetical protein [Pseudonocardiales bacterium]